MLTKIRNYWAKIKECSSIEYASQSRENFIRNRLCSLVLDIKNAILLVLFLYVFAIVVGHLQIYMLSA